MRRDVDGQSGEGHFGYAAPPQPHQVGVDGEPVDRHEWRHVAPALEAHRQPLARGVKPRVDAQRQLAQLDFGVEPLREGSDNARTERVRR